MHNALTGWHIFDVQNTQHCVWIADLMYNEHNIACGSSHNLNTGCLINETIWIAYKYDLGSNGDLNSVLNYPLFEYIEAW